MGGLRFAALGALAAGLLVSTPTPLRAAPAASADLPQTGIDPSLSAERIEALTAEAFYWGLNVAGFYELRHVFTQMEKSPAYHGVNRMQANYRLMDAKVRYATTINASTLYAGGMFDVSEEPLVIDIQRIAPGRYWSVQTADQYARWFLFVGSQFTGNDPQRYLIVGPNWHGILPADFRSNQIVRAPSAAFSLAVRVAVTDRSPGDMAAAGHVLDQVGAVPLSLWRSSGGRIVPLADQPIVRGDYRSFPRMDEIVDFGKTMTGVDMLQLLSLSVNDRAMTLQGDSATERALLARIAPLGVRQGALFDPARLSAEQRAAIERGLVSARAHAREALDRAMIDMNGWKLQSDLFDDPLNYPAKAGADDVAWGTPVPYQSHTIAYLFRDSCGRPLDGAHRYTMTFATDALPPVTEFWEIPVYDGQGYFVDNPIDRYSVTSYLAKSGAYQVKDGMLRFTFSAKPPADAERRNWLPIPESGPFQIAARFYGPMAPLVDGSYRMPGLVRTDGPCPR